MPMKYFVVNGWDKVLAVNESGSHLL